MNPFDWRGPQFLLFFWALAAAIAVAAHLLRCRAERGEVPKLKAVDPYLIACLRGGESEATKLAVVSLLARGLLTVQGHLVTAVEGARDKVRLELERLILQTASSPADARALARDPVIRQATAPLAAQLAEQGLTPSEAQRQTRTWIGLAAVAIMTAVAFRKLTLAIARGHHNVAFLIVSWFLALGLLVAVLARRQSRVGQRLLADLGMMFDALRVRLYRSPGIATEDETMLAGAVFGLAVTPLGKTGLFDPDTAVADGGSAGSCGGGCGGGGCGGCGS